MKRVLYTSAYVVSIIVSIYAYSRYYEFRAETRAKTNGSDIRYLQFQTKEY